LGGFGEKKSIQIVGKNRGIYISILKIWAQKKP
jgi:hypothetical protein